MDLSWTDTHCHLQDPRLAPGLDDVLARSRGAGVDAWVCCGTREADWRAVLDLAAREPGMRPMLGLHPWYVEGAGTGWKGRLEALLCDHEAGCGECGLDYALEGLEDPARRRAQVAAFRTQVHLARKLNRPLSIHCRKAWPALLEVLEEEGLPACGAVVHAYSGSPETARALVALGCSLSFGCALADPARTRARKVVTELDPCRLLLETDSPDLAPPSGALNEPANLLIAARAAAELRGLDLEALALQHARNVEVLFGGLR